MPSFFRPFFAYNGTSVVVEDTRSIIGVDIKNGIQLITPVNPGPPSVTLSNLPAGTILSWISPTTGLTNKTILATNENVTFNTYAELQTLFITPPPQSDTDINMNVTLKTSGAYANSISTFTHPIKVLAVADKPQVLATTSLDVLETGKVPLDVTVMRSADNDGSESLLVKFTINPSQGTLEGVASDLVTFTANTTTGEYTLIAKGFQDPIQQQSILNAHFSNGLIKFVPKYGFGGQANVTVEVRSVEKAGTGDLADPTPTDADTKTESVFTL